MANRNLRVDITADASAFNRGTKSAADSARVMERELARLEARQQAMGRLELQAAREMEASYARRRMAMASFSDSAGKAGLILGGALAAGLLLSARAAEQWESAFAGVRKVVDGNAQQMAALEQQLRGLARTMPATATEIAGVAEAAGQLGVARKDIASFTATAIRLGVSTNLSAQDAATGLSKLGNIMGVTADQADRAGATLVALGNAGASTEQDILEMGVRIAGAGRAIGLSEAQVLGYANALSSLGLEADAGGTAISRVFLNIDQAARTGGKTLATFAKVSGLSAEQFKTAYAKDAAGAVDSFVAGLGRVQSSGGDAAGVLRSLGLDEIRVRDTLLRVAGASDQLNASVKLGADSWRENSALVQEANRRFETAESRLAVARNQLNDAAIDIGGNVLPAFAQLAQDVGTAAEMFRDLPAPVKSAAVDLGLAAASIGLIGGAAAIAVPKVVALKTALGEMGPRGQAAAGALGRFGGFLTGPVGIGITAGLTVATIALGKWAKSQVEAKQRVEALTEAIKQDSGALAENVRQAVIRQLTDEKVFDAANKLKLNLKDVTDASLGNAAAQTRVNAAMNDYVAASQLSQGNARQLIPFEVKVRDAIGGTNDEVRDAVQAYKDRKAAGEDMGESSKVTAGKVKDEARAQAILAANTDNSTESIKALKTALDALNGKTLGMREAERAWQQSIDDVTAAAKENGRTLDDTTQKGRDNASALDDAARAASDRAKAVLDSTGSDAAFRDSLKQSRASLLKMAEQFHISKTAAQKYVDAVLAIPREMPTTVRLIGIAAARAQLAGLSAALRNTSGLQAGIYNSQGVTGGGAHDVTKRAQGGLIPGPASTADTVPAMLSTGEYVMSAASVQRYGAATFDRMNARHYAAGGLVTSTAPAVAGSLLSAYTQTLGNAVDPGERAEAIAKRASAMESLRIATMHLHEVEAKRHHTALELARADQAQAKARAALARATANLADVDARAALQRQAPLARLGGALGKGIHDGRRFIANIETLASRGFGELARQLAEQGDADAERLAADAVKAKPGQVAALQRRLVAATQVGQQRARLGDIARLIDAMRVKPNGSLDDLAALLGLDVTDVVDLARLIGGKQLAGYRGGTHLLSQLPGRASGGPVTAGHAYLVGERRPEVFVPSTSGRIVPDARAYAASWAASPGGGDVHLHVNASTTEAKALIREGIAELRMESAVRSR